MELLLGIYSGFVESSSDPQKMGRLKVRVPVLHGPFSDEDSDNVISTDSLVWALPSGLPLGATPESGGFAWLPALGDQVFVWFLDGEPEKPVWTWGPRSVSDAAAYKLYNEAGDYVPALAYTTKSKPADRKVISAYGQSILITAEMLHLRNTTGVLLELSSKGDYGLLSTSTGYSVSVAGSSTAGSHDGTVTLSTESGMSLSLDDSIETMVLSCTNLLISADDVHADVIDMVVVGVGSLDVEFSKDVRVVASSELRFVAANLNMYTTMAGIEAETLTVKAGIVDVTGSVHVTGNTTMNGMFTSLAATKLGGGSDPVARLSDLNVLVTWLNMHTHGNGNMGSPTSQPMAPAVVPTCSAIVTSA